jgi:chitinase
VLAVFATVGACGGSGATVPPAGGDGGVVSDLAMNAGGDLAMNADAAPATGDLATPADGPPAAPTLSIADVSVAEGDSGSTTATFTVTLSAASADTVTVDFATTDDTAKTGGGDYDAASGTLSFAPGTTTQTIDVTVHGDTVTEANELFDVTLSNPVNATLATAVAVATITNDDTGPTLTIGDVSKSEGNSGIQFYAFTVTLSASSTDTVTVDYTTADQSATAGSDYTAKSGTLTFAPGETSKPFSVVVNGDVAFEPNETFDVVLSNATNASIATAIGLGTIVNDDVDGPSIAIDDASVFEGDSGTTTLDFLLTLSAASTQAVTVQYATQNHFASGGSDYLTASGTVTFPAGTTTQMISVTVKGDTLYEANEDLYVNLTNATNANIAQARGIGVIDNDDTAPTFSIDDVQTSEGDGGSTNLLFTVSLSTMSGVMASVNLATSDGSATTSIVTGFGDYDRNSGQLSFPAGSLTQTFAVAVNGDGRYETDETFYVTLSSAVNATIADDTGVGTILNDDPLPALTVDNVTLAEGAAGNTTSFTFTVQMAPASSQQVTVQYGTADGSATNASFDYTPTSGILTIPAGTTQKTFTVPVTGDAAVEPDETFTVTLSSPTNATIGRATGTGTIVNDD